VTDLSLVNKTSLRFSSEILKRLGEELNPNLDQGILELVKNAYDADALECTVELASAGNELTIIVSDDGDGMTVDDIINGWLVLGHSSKSVTRPTSLGRLPAGNKGLGRLAALRMGLRTSLVTRPKIVPNREYVLDIDWAHFNQVDTIDEVGLAIYERELTREKPGTIITLSGLRSHLNRVEVKRLARGLLLLANPFDDDPHGFHPRLAAPEFVDLEKLVQQRYFNDAEFHLAAEVDPTGCAKATVTDWKNEELFAADHAELSRRNQAPYSCPTAQFDLWVFILDQKSFTARSATVSEVKQWLGEFGGVHLFINGLRVAPYGNSGNDWLELNLRRVQSPEVRPSTNTAIGRIAISDPTDIFLQKTDRSGLVEGEAFQELRRFATDALEWMARRRLDERDARRGVQRTEAPREVKETRVEVDTAIRALDTPAQDNIQRAFSAYDRAREKEVQVLRKEVQLYRTLSTAGIASATFAHESSQPIRVIMRNATQIAQRAQRYLGAQYDDALAGPIGRLLRQSNLLQAFGAFTLDVIDHEKRRASRVDIHTVIENVRSAFVPLLDDRQVTLTVTLADSHPFLRGSEAAVESVLINLIVNSLRAFERSQPGHREIVVRTTVVGDGEALTLDVLDNGPGIQDIDIKDIWLPGETTYPNGTGLGLTIVRDTVRDLGGTVNAIPHGEFGGAEIVVKLPILGV